MKTICLYFQVHQPFRLKKYRFFDIGSDHYYYDDFANKSIMQQVAEKSYIPANNLMLELIKKYGDKFKISYSISGSAIEQFEKYAPEVLESFQELAKTGNVEFLAETYSHSLASLISETEFKKQVKLHEQKIKEYFGQKPKVFRNTELIYSDKIGEFVEKLGYKAMLTEGAKHILGWKSPNFMYCNTISPKLKVLMRNYKLSDDIGFRFADQSWEGWPLTAEKFASWFNDLGEKEKLVNLFLDYETFGEHQHAETGIFDFLRNLPEEIFKQTDFNFETVSEAAKNYSPISEMPVPHPISWADEERDLSAWLGNEMQDEAFNKLYELERKVARNKDPEIKKDWHHLQASDHFYYMCTKWFSDGDVHKYFNPYDSPYNAFINYMNVLSDFVTRLETKK